MLSSLPVPRHLRKLPVPLLAVEGFLFLVLAGIWFYLWRYPVWSMDDIYFATRDGFTGGGTSLEAFWADFLSDVGKRNGRTADMAVQLIFAATTALWLVFPLICIAFSIAVYAAILWSIPIEWRSKPVPQFSAFSAALASVFIMSAFGPANPGLTIMFMAATVGYLGGFVLLVAVFLYSRKVYESEKISVTVLFFIFTIFSSWHHEIIAPMIALYLIGLALINSHAPRRSHLVILTGVILALSRFAAPGIWARRGDPTPRFPSDSVLVTTVSDWMFDLQGYMEARYKLWLIAIVVLLVLTGIIFLSRPVVSKLFIVTALTNSASLLILSASLVRLTSARAVAPEADYKLVFQSATALIGFFSCVVHLICMVILFVVLRHTKFAPLFLPLACAYSGLALTVFTRTAWDRPLFIAVTLVIVFIASTVIFIFQEALEPVFSNAPLRRFSLMLFSAVVVLYVAVSTITPAKAFLRYVNENTAIQGKITRNIEGIHNGENSVLFLPEKYPYPQYFEWYEPRESLQEQYLQYYGLDPSTPVIIVPADQIP